MTSLLLGPMTKRTLTCDNTRRKWESVLLSQIGRGSPVQAARLAQAQTGGRDTARGSSPLAPPAPRQATPPPPLPAPPRLSFPDAITCSMWCSHMPRFACLADGLVADILLGRYLVMYILRDDVGMKEFARPSHQYRLFISRRSRNEDNLVQAASP